MASGGDSDNNFEDEEEEDEFELLREVLMMIPEEQLERPFVEADQLVLAPTISGDLAQGGTVVAERRSLVLEYNCRNKGVSTIQLTVPLKYFRDLRLFFVKECPHTYYYFGELRDVEAKLGFLFFALLLGVLAIVFATAYNIFMRRRSGVDAVPGAKPLILYALRFQAVRASFLGAYLSRVSGLYFIPQQELSKDDFDRDSDFRLGDLNNNNNSASRIINQQPNNNSKN